MHHREFPDISSSALFAPEGSRHSHSSCEDAQAKLMEQAEKARKAAEDGPLEF